MKKLLILHLIFAASFSIRGAVEFDLLKGVDLTLTNSITQSLLNQLVDLGTISATNKGGIIRKFGLGGGQWPSVTDNPRYTNFIWLDMDTTPPTLKTYVKTGIAVDVYTNWVPGTIAPGSITSTELANNSVNSDKLQTNAVQFYHLTNNAVISSKINDQAVIAGKIAPNGVISGNIAFGAVNGGSISNNSITFSNIAANTINRDQLQNQLIGPAQLTNGLITSLVLTNNSITNSMLATNISYGVVKAWAFVSSDGTMRKGFNITNCVRTATGNYTLSFGNAYAPSDTNYCAVATGMYDSGFSVIATIRTNNIAYVSVNCGDDSSTDIDRGFSITIMDTTF